MNIETMNFDCIDGDFFESLGNGNSIVYSDIDYVERTFETDTHHSILITHNGDRNVTEDLFQKFLNCGKYDYWFAQNVAFRHKRLIPIPIGFERKRWCRFSKFDILREYSQKNVEPTKLLYGNFSVSTSHIKRLLCYNVFKGKDWFTDRVKEKLPSPQALNEDHYRRYCQEILEHKFVLCPEGNGLDTHRLWEVVALGRIPVVLHNVFIDYFQDIPMLRLDRWDEFDALHKKMTYHTNDTAKELRFDIYSKLLNQIIRSGNQHN